MSRKFVLWTVLVAVCGVAAGNKPVFDLSNSMRLVLLPPGSYTATTGLDTAPPAPRATSARSTLQTTRATTVQLDTTVLQALSMPLSILVLLEATAMPQDCLPQMLLFFISISIQQKSNASFSILTFPFIA